jgi:hypothetical protein
MILGFGVAEDVEARAIIHKCLQAATDCPECIKDAIVDVAAEYTATAHRYRAMDRSEAPERYTYFFAFHLPIYTGRYIVEFTMHHINRRHPMSPDGWALMVTKWMLNVNDVEASIYKEVAA